MNPELVKFHLPTTDQFSVAVDTHQTLRKALFSARILTRIAAPRVVKKADTGHGVRVQHVILDRCNLSSCTAPGEWRSIASRRTKWSSPCKAGCLSSDHGSAAERQSSRRPLSPRL